MFGVAATEPSQEASLIADLFLDRGQVIASLAGRGGTLREFLSEEEPLIGTQVVGLLVDGGTSGAAEVFSAALIDNQRVFFSRLAHEWSRYDSRKV